MIYRQDLTFFLLLCGTLEANAASEELVEKREEERRIQICKCAWREVARERETGEKRERENKSCSVGEAMVEDNGFVLSR